MAEIIANIAGTKVIFDLPDEIEKKGFSKAVIARLDYSKAVSELQWNPTYDIKSGLNKTISILKKK